MRYILAFCLFAGGYVLGTLEWPVTAQAPMQGFNSDGSSFLYYPPTSPGGVGQYYGSNGQSGQLYAPPAPLSGFRSPC